MFEMAQSFGMNDFNLSDESVNVSYAQNFLNDSRKKFIQSFPDPYNINLYKIGCQYVAIDEDKQHVFYYTRWKETTHPFVGHPVACQIAVWRNVICGYNEMATDIFFNKLLPLYGVISINILEPAEGTCFLVRRISEAFIKDLFVYHDTHEEITLLRSASEFNRAKVRQVLISSVELT